MTEYLPRMGEADVRTVLTIHNIAFPGSTDPGRLHSLRLDPARLPQRGV